MEANPKQVEDYRKGKEKLFGFFVGEVMKQTKGKANPQLVNELLKEKLKGIALEARGKRSEVRFRKAWKLKV